MNKIQWTIEQLEIFVASVEQGSFSAASRKLRIAQSKVSNSVSDLELILGVELFFRTKKLPTPTAEGKKFYDYAKSIIAKCLQTNSDMMRISFGMEASLSIAIEDGVPLDKVDEVLKELSVEFPSLSLTIINSTHKEIMITNLGQTLLEKDPFINFIHQCAILHTHSLNMQSCVG